MRMFRRRIVEIAMLLAGMGCATSTAAHPAPFSYLDIRIGRDGLDVTLVAHIFDLGHDLGVDPPEHLLDPAVLTGQGAAIAALLQGRLQLTDGGRQLTAGSWSAPEALPERQSVRIRATYAIARPPAVITVRALLFPYDPVHQTFINFYEGDRLTSQAILDVGFRRFEYFPDTTPGALGAARRFTIEGIRHVLTSPDHLLFLAGLLLLGGSIRRLVVAVTAFTVGHTATLTLAMLHVMTPSQRIVEPAIALTIVYLGADNLLVQGGRDLRAWIALAFGFTHGFSFATVMRDIGLPGRALGWSVFSVNTGLEIGQVLFVVAGASAMAALCARSEWTRRRIAFAGSIVVIAAGTIWFVQRVFFGGGIS
jgi:hydrogenase/urease accessory protein HupE